MTPPAPIPTPTPETDVVEMPWGTVQMTFLTGKAKAAQTLVRGLEALDQQRGGDVPKSAA